MRFRKNENITPSFPQAFAPGVRQDQLSVRVKVEVRGSPEQQWEKMVLITKGKSRREAEQYPSSFVLGKKVLTGWVARNVTVILLIVQGEAFTWSSWWVSHKTVDLGMLLLRVELGREM